MQRIPPRYEDNHNATTHHHTTLWQYDNSRNAMAIMYNDLSFVLHKQLYLTHSFTNYATRQAPELVDSMSKELNLAPSVHCDAFTNNFASSMLLGTTRRNVTFESNP